VAVCQKKIIAVFVWAQLPKSKMPPANDIHIKVIRKVRKTQHQNPLFGHKGHEMRFLKNNEKRTHWARLKRSSTGTQTQIS